MEPRLLALGLLGRGVGCGAGGTAALSQLLQPAPVLRLHLGTALAGERGLHADCHHDLLARLARELHEEQVLVLLGVLELVLRRRCAARVRGVALWHGEEVVRRGRGRGVGLGARHRADDDDRRLLVAVTVVTVATVVVARVVVTVMMAVPVTVTVVVGMCLHRVVVALGLLVVVAVVGECTRSADDGDSDDAGKKQQSMANAHKTPLERFEPGKFRNLKHITTLTSFCQVSFL